MSDLPVVVIGAGPQGLAAAAHLRERGLVPLVLESGAAAGAAINEALAATPSIANADPYGEGWLIILKPEDWDSVKGGLVAGTQVAGPYEAKMTADGFAGCG